MLSLLLASTLSGQTIQALKTGDTIPDLPDAEFLNANSTIRLSALRGKIVILDFWNVQCKSCIASMPAMDSLQKKFGKDLQIILITYNKGTEVKELFERLRRPFPDLPMIINDSILNALFPHRGDPYHVWIDKKGMIRKITAGNNASPKNVSKAINENIFSGSDLIRIPGYTFTQPIIEPIFRHSPDLIQQYRLLTHHINSLDMSSVFMIRLDSNSQKRIRITAVNQPILSLYTAAYLRELFDFPLNIQQLAGNNRIELIDPDPERFNPPTDQSALDSWNTVYSYCYEAVSNGTDTNTAYANMKIDLDRYFGFKSEIKMVRKKCFVLVRTDTVRRFDKKEPGNDSYMSERSDTLIIKNMTIRNSLLKFLTLRYQHLGIPVIDETGFKGKIDLELYASLSNLEQVRKQLHKWGLDLIEAVRPVKIIFINTKR
jgi:thiol-disulfide isomerase/thioredoxin